VRPARRRVLWSVGAAMTAVAAASCSIPSALPSGGAHPAGRATAASGRVITLSSIGTLKALFNQADGHARLVLIFSPT
jgi:hypothetical protein